MTKTITLHYGSLAEHFPATTFRKGAGLIVPLKGTFPPTLHITYIPHSHLHRPVLTVQHPEKMTYWRNGVHSAPFSSRHA